MTLVTGFCFVTMTQQAVGGIDQRLCSMHSIQIVDVKMPERLDDICVVTLPAGSVVSVTKRTVSIPHLIIQTMGQEMILVVKKNLTCSAGMTVFTLVHAVTHVATILLDSGMHFHPVGAMVQWQQAFLCVVAQLATLNGQRSGVAFHAERHLRQVPTGGLHTGGDTAVALFAGNISYMCRVAKFGQIC